MSQPDSLPDQMSAHQMSPHLFVDDASKAIEFYKNAFGAVELGRHPAPDGKRLMHASLRINNSLRYESPEVAGFKLKSLYAFGGQANSSVGNVFNPSLDYKVGALQLGASYMRSNTSASNTSTYVVLGGSYDFGLAKAAFPNYRQRDLLAGSATSGKDAWELSAMVPMGVHSLWLSYGRTSGRAADTDASSASARYGYALSKRTSLYAGYSQIHNGAKSSFTFNSASNAGPVVAAGKNVNQVVLGISHFF